MKQIVNEITLNLKIIGDYQGEEGLKPIEEYAEDIAQFVCDECAVSGNVCSYEILGMVREIK